MKKRIKYLLLFFAVSAFILFTGYYFRRDDYRIEKIKRSMQTLNDSLPYQKVFIHFDRNSYNAGDNIWLKAYVLCGDTNLPDTLSNNLYIDMVNSSSHIVQSKMLRLQNGVAAGDYILKDTVQEGVYLFRAYTNRMLNYDTDYLFKKYIEIKNPSPTYFSKRDFKKQKKQSRVFKRQLSKYSISFFPEGGNLLKGFENRVAFKAIDENGNNIKVEGEIEDKQGNTVTSFESTHNGMGYFTLYAVSDSYEAKVKLPDGKEKKYPLPQPLTRGYAMQTDLQKNHIAVTIKSNHPPTKDKHAGEIIIAGQSGHRVCYARVSQALLESDSCTIRIPKNQFPAGIAQITLFDSNTNPQCERLVFIHHPKAFMNIDISWEPRDYSHQAKTGIQLRASDSNGKAIAADLSVAIIDNQAQNYQSGYDADINAAMLLTSDLKGKIKNPNQYFVDQKPETLQKLDLLMMTHGWRRFVWKKILQNEYPEIKYTQENSIEIEGRITRDLLQIPIKQSKVTLTILDEYNDAYVTKTNNQGRFHFEGLVYYDTLHLMLEARKPNGKKNLVIEVFDNKPPTPSYEIRNRISEDLLATKGHRRYTKNTESEKEDDGNMRLYGNADYVLDVDDNQVSGYSNLIQFMQGRIPGVAVFGDRILIRGISSIYSSTDPLVLVDGTPVDVSVLNSIAPQDVDKIEVLKGPSASIYGSRGANGVIAVYTKRGKFMKRGVLEFEIMGYYKAREFYHPEFTGKNAETNIRNYATAYWNPFVKIEKDGKAEIEFSIPQKIATCKIIVNGITYTGKTGSAQKIITVR